MTALPSVAPRWPARARPVSTVGDGRPERNDSCSAAIPARAARVRVGRIWIDAVTFNGALDAIAAQVDSGVGGSVFTPNVDHVITADLNRDFRRAYRAADLVLADGAPIIWASHLLGVPLPAKVSGSDLILPLARIAGERGWRVYLLGGEPGVAALAAERLRSELAVNIVGIDDAVIRLDDSEAQQRLVTDRISAARPDLLFVALGAPKQEQWIHKVRDSLGPIVAVGVGASLDFVAGKVRRAPPWMSIVGLEWVFRLAQEPRRLWRRYLLRGPRFLSIVFRSARLRRNQRMRLPYMANTVEKNQSTPSEALGPSWLFSDPEARSSAVSKNARSRWK